MPLTCCEESKWFQRAQKHVASSATIAGINYALNKTALNVPRVLQCGDLPVVWVELYLNDEHVGCVEVSQHLRLIPCSRWSSRPTDTNVIIFLQSSTPTTVAAAITFSICVGPVIIWTQFCRLCWCHVRGLGLYGLDRLHSIMERRRRQTVLLVVLSLAATVHSYRYRPKQVSYAKANNYLSAFLALSVAGTRESFLNKGSKSKIKFYLVTWYVDFVWPHDISGIWNFWPQLQILEGGQQDPAFPRPYSV